jgi:murein DD-endopeptidase MepM/ murein hydrolase activator NlpD
MALRAKRFVYMTVILELSLVLGLSLYFVSHRDSNSNMEIVELSNIDNCLPLETESSPEIVSNTQEIKSIKKNQTSSEFVKCPVSSNIGGPYTVAPSLNMSIYHAKKGDNLSSVAKENGLDFFTILSVNGLESSNKLSIGQKLRIPNQRGIIHKIQSGESIEDIALKYNVNIRKIIRVNQILDPTEIRIGMELFIPDATITLDFQESLLEKSGVDFGGKKKKENERMMVVNNRVRSRGKTTKSSGSKIGKELLEVESGVSFINPTNTKKVSSNFGYRRDPFTRGRAYHSGVDIDTDYGADVRASMGGTVTYAGWMGGYGKLVIVTHENGYSTRYGHLSRINVKKGSVVKQGQLLGAAGSTGRSTGAHVHFEVRKNDKALNPAKILNSKTKITDFDESDELVEELDAPEKD